MCPWLNHRGLKRTPSGRCSDTNRLRPKVHNADTLMSPALGFDAMNPRKSHCRSFTSPKIGTNSWRTILRHTQYTNTSKIYTRWVLSCLTLNTGSDVYIFPQWNSVYNLPNCWIALSALHGNSKVMWTLRLWFLALRSACNEIPELAASEMIAMFCIKS